MIECSAQHVNINVMSPSDVCFSYIHVKYDNILTLHSDVKTIVGPTSCLRASDATSFSD